MSTTILTPMRRKILAAIVSYHEEHGYPPSVRDLGDAVGLSSTSTVQAHLVTLMDAGYISRATGPSRGQGRTLKVVIPPPAVSAV